MAYIKSQHLVKSNIKAAHQISLIRELFKTNSFGTTFAANFEWTHFLDCTSWETETIFANTKKSCRMFIFISYPDRWTDGSIC